MALLPVTLTNCYITISPPCQDRHTMCWRSCVSSFIEFLVNFPLSNFQHWYQSAAEGASSKMNYGTCMLAGVAVQALSRGHQSTSECLRFAQENISQIKKLKTWEIMDFYRTSKLISATLGVSRTIYVNVDSPYLGFPHFNVLGGYQWEKLPCIIFLLPFCWMWQYREPAKVGWKPPMKKYQIALRWNEFSLI